MNLFGYSIGIGHSFWPSSYGLMITHETKDTVVFIPLEIPFALVGVILCLMAFKLLVNFLPPGV
jgi:hypothetical protein